MKNVIAALFLLCGLTVPAPSAGTSVLSTPWDLAIEHKFRAVGTRFSGVTFVPPAGHYLLLDDHCRIFEMKAGSRAIAELRTVPTFGFEDCEAIAYVPGRWARKTGYRVAIAEEARGTVAVFDFGPGTTTVERGDARIHTIETSRELLRGNSGLEALAAAREGGAVVGYAAKEERPKKIYRFVWGRGRELVSVPWDAERALAGTGDMADLFYARGRLLILDEKMGVLREVRARDGRIDNVLPLPSRVGRFEGVCLGATRRGLEELVVVAEKRSVFVFRRPRAR